MRISDWSSDVCSSDLGKLFSAASDEVYRVRSDLMGTETIEAKGGPVEAEHYKLSGELDRDLWYSPEGELLKMKYESDDGETFEFVRRSEEHTSELQSLMRISYAVVCLKKNTRLKN